MSLFVLGTLGAMLGAAVLLCLGVALRERPRSHPLAALSFSVGIAAALLFGGLLLYGHVRGLL